MPPTQVLLTTGQVAGRFSVTPNTVRRWAQEGLLRHITLPSGQIRFRQSDVDAFLADHETEVA